MAFYVKGATYSGKLCLKCNGVVRYKNSRRCVTCKHELSVAGWEKEKACKQVELRHDMEVI